ncbi:MAG: DHH family phosphoesterase [Halanaeroarchaeum sp.]
MVSWLLLGHDGLDHDLVETLAGGAGDLQVVDPEEAYVEQLRNAGIDATVGDVTDRQVLSSIDASPDVVVAACGVVSTSRTAIETAQSVFGDRYAIGFLPPDVDRRDRGTLEAVADEVFDPGRAIVDHLADFIGGESVGRLGALRRTLSAVEDDLAIVMHDNPDPDAIAAAVALERIAGWHGVDARPVYYGRISHQENRAFVNLLGLDLENLEPGEAVDASAIALVDHSSPGVNDHLPPDAPITLVVDHHSTAAAVDASYVDVRDAVGATSTLLVEYIRAYHVDVDEVVATALLYGIRVDTDDFTRGVTRADFEAAAALMPFVDLDVLERIEEPSIDPETMETIARAIRNRERTDQILTSCVGPIGDRDALAQAADRLLALEGVHVTLVYGHSDGTVYLSARSRGVPVDLGEILRETFGDMGSAGGHADMAGAQLSLGVFEEVDDEADLTEMVEGVVSPRFVDAVAALLEE